MIPRKRHADVLVAFARLRRDFPSCRLVFVGDGALMDDLKRQAHDLGVADGSAFSASGATLPQY
jgi:glycosyltransferase involved in cell wall biosynthesis